MCLSYRKANHEWRYASCKQGISLTGVKAGCISVPSHTNVAMIPRATLTDSQRLALTIVLLTLNYCALFYSYTCNCSFHIVCVVECRILWPPGSGVTERALCTSVPMSTFRVAQNNISQYLGNIAILPVVLQYLGSSVKTNIMARVYYTPLLYRLNVNDPQPSLSICSILIIG